MNTPFRLYILLLGLVTLSNSMPAGSNTASNLQQSCIQESLQTSECDIMNINCQCSDADFISSSEDCVLSQCTMEQSTVTKNITQTLCGVTPRDKIREYNWISYILVTLSCCIVSARLVYRKLSYPKTLSVDDWFILLTMVVSIPSAIVNVRVFTSNGLGRNIWTLRPEEITNFARGFYIIAILYLKRVFFLKDVHFILLSSYLPRENGPTPARTDSRLRHVIRFCICGDRNLPVSSHQV
ncbi:hypothetical protein BKA67DRAFT_585514 [Truncatella angustata]|uniref:Extracellular membrane protein CFEM domain-containing protein n=1 Tax=Truncatella angustata TaxID=152316 RepID=A0A9P8UC03_9PEZI|nr:uncharacterized protein BKA67DRAFT_585514 [Truncatella angustata]KAH6645560.1 hypothetical protein BKA67DRAFT_585514 [Truncatella angustata]